MGYPRSLTVSQDAGGIYHCYSRCVRKERLLESPHRVEDLERRLEFLSRRVFAIDLIEFKPMGNHVHGIVRTHPELAWCWTDEEVARRWLLLALAGRRSAPGPEEEPGPNAVAALAARKPRIEELRRRLADLGSYHSAWKEWAAKRWNREDGVSGHFWQGRYGVTTALDEGAVLTQSVYVLLNAVYAGLETELGTKTPGSLKTRIERLLKEATDQAHEGAMAEVYERKVVHASWTPVYPCDPGSAAELDDAEFARRVAAGKHRASFRSALREEARDLALLAAEGERDEVELAARELRTLDDAEHVHHVDQMSHPVHTARAAPRPRRPRLTRGPRRRDRAEELGQATPPRTELKPDEMAWLQPWPNPFHYTRLIGGAVPVVTGVTLGMLVALADREGRNPRPDKRGCIAKDAEPALASLGRTFLGLAPDAVNAARGRPNWGGGAPPDSSGSAVGSSSLPAAVGLAEELARRVRSGVESMMTCVSTPEATDPESRGGPNRLVRMTIRGTAFGSPDSLKAEAARRRGTCVHAARPRLRE